MAVNRALGFKIKTLTSKPAQIYMKKAPDTKPSNWTYPISHVKSEFLF